MPKLKFADIWRRVFRPTPARMILSGFLLLILAGGLLLMLPVSSNPNKSIGFVDAMFTAVSAVCVTGLVVVEIGRAHV